MAMSASNQAIVGGTVLRIPAIQSPDYVPGVSGWIIRADGSAEFNNGTFRGSIEVGPLTGQHFIVNNPVTGDVIDVYDSSNRLVMFVDQFGRVGTIEPTGRNEIVMSSNGLNWQNLSRPPFNPPGILGQGDSANGNLIEIFTNEAVAGGGFGSAELDLSDVTGSPFGHSYISALQRSTSTVQGNQGFVVQTDNFNPNNFLNSGIYTATVSGAGGMATFAHNCTFTPVGGVVGPLTHFSQWNWNSAFGVNGFNATNAQITMFVPNGTVVNNGVAATFHAMFWG